MQIYIDIETIPDQSHGALDAFIEEARANFKAPSTLTKEQAAKDLGMSDANEIKFTSKDAMIAKWEAEFASSRAEEVGEATWRKTSFDGAKGHVAVIGLAFGNDEPFSLWETNYAELERDVISETFSYINAYFEEYCDRRRPCIVGHNHTGFDLRFLWHRAVILGIKPPIWWPHNARPWDTDVVFDTMIQWSGTGNRISMDNLCKALGIPGKPDDIDGSKVWDYIKEGRIKEVADYCEGDVTRTRECFKRMTFF